MERADPRHRADRVFHLVVFGGLLQGLEHGEVRGDPRA